MNYLLFDKKPLLLLLLLFISSYTAPLKAESLVLSPIATIPVQNESPWLTVIANPSTTNGYFIANKKGDIYTLVADEISQKPFFSLHSSDHQAIELTAVTLHPNFSLREQEGFHTFYVAHIEEVNTQSKKPRLVDGNIDAMYDMVITEWQSLNTSVDPESKREILRIGVPKHSTHIKQLSFSPFAKVWNDDFGLLYVALGMDSTHKSNPLYSGAILRIDPKKFGLRNYTVPNSNPFIKQDDVPNELFVIGLQDINQFIWPKKENNQFLIHHQYNALSQLSLVNANDDFRDTSPRDVVLQPAPAIAPYSLTHYRGRELGQLWDNILFLADVNNTWQMQSLSMANNTNETKTPTVQWQYESKSIEDNGPLSLFQGGDQELLVLNQTSHALARMTTEELVTGKTQIKLVDQARKEETLTSNANYFIVIVITLLSSWLFYLNRKKRISARYIVNQQLGRFEVSESQQHVSLFKRHEKNADTVLALSDITESTVMLNHVLLTKITADHAFSNESEIDIREQFNNERREKMVSDRLRQLNLELVDKKGNKYPIFAYLRKGDNRITRKKFGVVIEEIIDWCWLISNTIAPEQTGERTQKPIVIEKHAPVSPYQPKTQANQSTTATYPVNQRKTSLETTPLETEADVLKGAIQPNDVANSSTDDTPQPSVSLPISSDDTLNTELISALEKLAHLKQQGMLTDEEYANTKQKILERFLK